MFAGSANCCPRSSPGQRFASSLPERRLAWHSTTARRDERGRTKSAHRELASLPKKLTRAKAGSSSPPLRTWFPPVSLLPFSRNQPNFARFSLPHTEQRERTNGDSRADVPEIT